MVLCTPSFPVINDLRGDFAGSLDKEEKNDDALPIVDGIQVLVAFWFAKHRRAAKDNIMM
jgi:hypothetical protein